MPNGFNDNATNGILKVNTNSIALFAPDSTMLRVSFSNDSMFLSIIPKVDDPAGGRARWPKELGHSVGFRPAQAMALYKGFMQTIAPDIEAKRDHAGYCVVPLNMAASTLCGFSWAGGHAVFSIFNGVGVDRTCSEISNFMFEPTQMIDTYNPATGAYTVIEVQAQLFVIVEALRVFGEMGANFVGHGAKNAMGWSMNRILDYLKAMADKMNVQLPNSYSFSGNNFGGGMSNFPTAGASAAMSQQPSLNNAGDVNMNAVNWSSASQVEAEKNSAGAPQVEQVSSLDALIG